MSGRDDRRHRRADPVARTRQAGWEDRDQAHYWRKRVTARRRRAERDRQDYEPGPPGDHEWTVASDEDDGLHRVRPPTSLGEELQALVERRGWDERLRGTALWSRWEEIVGAELAARCEPAHLRGGVLTVRADNQVWATQLRYLVTPLRTRANEVLGREVVTRIEVVVGRRPDASGGDAAP